MSITFRQVSYSYDTGASKTWALQDVDFTIEKGSFTAVIGHTGSGKSTLIQHCNGLLRPTQGTVEVDGQSTAHAKNRKAIRAKVGMVFQYPEYQLFGATVKEDVGFGPKNMGLGDEEIDLRVHQALKQVGLVPEDVLDKSPFEFSGGQRRRIAFAGVLAMNPEYLVLDEPMAGLDPQGRHEIMSYISALHRQGMTVIMVSHSMDDVADFAQQVVVLKGGEVFASGTPEDVFAQADELRRIGLTVPVTTRLAKDLAARGFVFEKTCYTLDELADAIAVQLGGVTLGPRAEVEAYG